MMQSQEIILFIVGGLLSIVNLYFWNDKKRIEKKIEDHDTLISEIKARQQHFATHAEVRELIRESIEPLRQDQREIKADVKEALTLIGHISQNLAVINAVRGIDPNVLNHISNR
jgi:hypothetical protein